GVRRHEFQVEAGGEARAGAGHHQRAGVAAEDGVERRLRVARDPELERIHGWAVEAEDGDRPVALGRDARGPFHRDGYIRKTPNVSAPCTTFVKAALSAMPRTVRVSRGSITPSSQTRPVA